MDFSKFSLENLSLDSLLLLTSKWGLVSFTALLFIFALLVAKQTFLLDRFLPTRGGNVLRGLSCWYAAVVLVLLVVGVLTM